MKLPINIAKARFAEIVRLAEDGTDVILTRHGKEVARIVSPVVPVNRPLIGIAKGSIQINSDFDAPL